MVALYQTFDCGIRLNGKRLDIDLVQNTSRVADRHTRAPRYNFVANSTDVVFDNLDISGYSQSKNEAKNTDGWDTYRSSNLVIQNAVVNNGDDCVSFKPNSTEILVQNMHCNGSHGISVGSLGQYVGEVDIVQNVYVRATPDVGICNPLTTITGLQYRHVQC